MNFQLPDYWLPRREYLVSEDLRRDFDRLLAKAGEEEADAPLDYRLDAPKWVFLCYAAEQHGLALHGSANGDIRLFEPHQPQDLNEFGAQMAVYAAADGIWPMYFAIVDRERATTLTNACIRIEFATGLLSQPYYLFSLDRRALKQHPYRNGFVYLLPGESFSAEPSIPFGEVVIRTAQLVSPVAVKPLAKLSVAPADFPFLAQMLAHDDARLEEYAAAIRSGLPWPGEEDH
jgi:hypothetical protein